MCNTCHDKYLKQGGWGNSWHPPHCSGPQTCPLKVKHPANGMEFCLGEPSELLSLSIICCPYFS